MKAHSAPDCIPVLGPSGSLSTSEGCRFRPGQLDMAQAIGAALESQSVLVVEAGTGTGKTFAYLVPALLSGRKLMISTGTRALQDQLVQRDLPMVRKALGYAASVEVLKGRSNYVCHHHLERHLADGRFANRQDAAVLRRIKRFARSSASGDRAECAEVPEDAPAWSLATSTHDTCLASACGHLARCFVNRARQRAHKADIVVVNHHLFCADLALRSEGVSELLPEVDGVIFDEAHFLPDTALRFFGHSWSLRQTQDLVTDLLRVGLREVPDAADWLACKARLDQCMRQLRLQAGLPGRLAWDREDPRCDAIAEAIVPLQSELHSVCDCLAANSARSPEVQLLRERVEAMLATLDGFFCTDPDRSAAAPLDGDGEMVRWWEVSRSGLSLHRSPIDCAALFRRALGEEPKSLVFTSATLGLAGRIDLFGRQLGFAEVRTLRVESPFDYARQARLYIPRGCGDPGHPDFVGAVAAHIWPLLSVNCGRAFVLCTTLRMVGLLHQLLRAHQEKDSAGKDIVFLVQGEQPKAVILERFRQLRAPVLLGSAGFWSGVDVAGQQLSLVVIDKLPFVPPDDPIIRARMRKALAAGEDFFSNWQLPQAAISLKQGAGRLIRSENDRGLLVVCDERLVMRSYGRALLRSLPPFVVVRQAAEAHAFLTALKADGTLAPAAAAPTVAALTAEAPAVAAAASVSGTFSCPSREPGPVSVHGGLKPCGLHSQPLP